MKKFLPLILSLSILLSGCAHQPPEVLRLHVIANSDNATDQQIKYAVRDQIRDYLGQFADQATDIDTTYQIAKDNQQQILDIAEATLHNASAGYDAQVLLGEYDFPMKVYGDTEYPAGKYKAVKVVLGEGQGKNWWCVLFPPLCIIDSSQTLTTSSESSAEPLLSENPAENPSPSPENTLQYKSILKEWWEKIF